MSKSKVVTLVIIVGLIIVGVVLGDKIFETNEAGQFQIKRAFITGEMSVKHDAGMYGQWFGKIFTYNNVATIGFGREKGEGSADIGAIPVIFNDGSKATNSGLVRIKLPNSGQREQLLHEYPRGYEHFITAGVLPVIRNAVKLSANLRSAQDAYTTLALYQQAVQDQIENGTYVTYSAVDTITNATGDFETRQVTKIKLDENRQPIRKPNRLQELGCEVLECVIDVPDFDPKVEEMIALRKDEAMKTELAKQSALRAKQDAITAEQQGLANVAKAKYEKEVEKVKEVTDASKKFEVEEFAAKTALETAKKIEAEGKAQAAANRALVSAGLTPQQQMELQIKIAEVTSANIAKASTPQVVIMGGEGGGSADEVMKVFGAERSLELINKMGSVKK
jgi:hypothetical protein